MNFKKTYSVILLTCLIGVLVFNTNLPSANSQTSEVPDWIKRIAKWQEAGVITEGEYLRILQYLDDKGILEISSTQKLQLETQSSSLDSIRAQFFLVRFSGGEFETPLEISTFSNYLDGDRPIYLVSFNELRLETSFTLGSNPSVDKLEFYEVVASFYNPGKKAELFDVEIDILTGNKVPLVTTFYSDCSITEYLPYLENSVIYYPFSGILGGEIRDRTVFECSGVDVIVEKSDKPKDLEFTDSSHENRAISYVVHFFGSNFVGVYSLETFSKFAPSDSRDDSPYDIITYSSNSIDSDPQFFLESLPSADKKQLYEFYSRYVNLGKVPRLFDVSIDMILEDGTILQRWNYRDCKLIDYGLRLEDSRLSFPFAKKPGAEIRDKSDFLCIGISLDIGPDLPQRPINDSKTIQESFIGSRIPDENQRAKSFKISIYGGELPEPILNRDVYSFENLRRERVGLSPNEQANQYDRGFTVESLPTLDKKIFYEFLVKYVNSGKSPEPFDVTLDTILGDGSILHRFHYANCEIIDITWYLQQGNWLHQYSGKLQEEIRERYSIECEGFKIEFP
jgi:hypothetical protein